MSHPIAPELIKWGLMLCLRRKNQVLKYLNKFRKGIEKVTIYISKSLRGQMYDSETLNE